MPAPELLPCLSDAATREAAAAPELLLPLGFCCALAAPTPEATTTPERLLRLGCCHA